MRHIGIPPPPRGLMELTSQKEAGPWSLLTPRVGQTEDFFRPVSPLFLSSQFLTVSDRISISNYGNVITTRIMSGKHFCLCPPPPHISTYNTLTCHTCSRGVWLQKSPHPSASSCQPSWHLPGLQSSSASGTNKTRGSHLAGSRLKTK